MNRNQLQMLQKVFAQQKQQEKGLVEFKCGQCTYNESTKLVQPQDKRGTLKFFKNESGILQMEWIDRISKEKGLSLTLFPKTAKWEKVGDCKDGRVYLLRLIDSNRKHFFWMQEPDEIKEETTDDANKDANDDANKDENNKNKKNKPDKYQIWFEKINWLCDGKAVSDSDENKQNNNTLGGGGGGGAQSSFQQQMLQQQQALLAQYGLGAGGGGTGGANAGGNNANANDFSRLLLQAMQGQGGNNNNANAPNNNNIVAQMQEQLKQQAKARAEKLKKEPDLEDILNPQTNADEINTVLDDEKVLETLQEHLPDDMKSKEDIIEQLESPQFQGALRQLQRAINGPQMDMLLMQLGIQVNNNTGEGVGPFIKAIIDKYGNNNNNDNKKDNDDVKEDKDVEMNDKNKDDKDKDKDQDKDKNGDSDKK